MLPPKHLALAYDLQSLNDILDSSLNFKEVTLIVPASFYKNNTLMGNTFHKIIHIEDYLHSGAVEASAYQELSSTPYESLIAPHEVDILRAARLRELMSIPGQHYQSALAFRRKTAMKKILQQNQIKIPFFKAIQSPADIIDFMNQAAFPLVVKPDLGTGSEGVTILHTSKDVLTYLKEAPGICANQLLDKEVEEFVDGKMYHINGFVQNGEVIGCWPSVYPQQSICMTQGKFASSYLLSPDNSLVPRLNAYTRHILKLFPISFDMPFHLEVFINQDDDIIFCEIASRIGGKGVRQSWQESFNVSLSRLFVHAQANQPALNENVVFPHHPAYLTGEIWFPTQPGKLNHIEAECPFPWVKEYHTFYQPGDIIHQKTKDINDCLCGISLMVAQTEDEMQQRLSQVTNWVYDTVKWSSL